ncbi:MAG: choice-of-anchor Q domain-containing protein [Armatimonadota bacterium]
MPLRTIQRGADLARWRGGNPGDTVLVKGGTYREMVVLRYGGWEPQSVWFKAAPGEEVCVKGSDVVTGWEHDSGHVWKKAGWPHPSRQVFCDDKVLRQVAYFSSLPDFGEVDPDPVKYGPSAGRKAFSNPHLLRPIDGGKDAMTAGSFFVDMDKDVLYVWLEDGSDPNDHFMEVSVRPHLFVAENLDVCGIVLDGFKMRHTSAARHSFRSGGVVMGPYRWIIQNCDIQWTCFTGLQAWGKYHLIRNNIINCNGCCGIDSGTPVPVDPRTGPFPLEETVLEGNVTNWNNYRAFSRWWHCGGIKLIPCVSRVRVTKHEAVGNHGPGIWFDTDCLDGEISLCRTTDNESHGIFYELNGRGLIWGNISLRNATGVANEGSETTRIYNNYCAGNDVGISVIRDTYPEKWTAKESVVRNNILVDNIRADIRVADSEHCFNNVVDHNIYYSSKGSPRFSMYLTYDTVLAPRANEEKLFTDLAAWQKATGWDEHSQVADPRCVDPANEDFHLSPDSPAIDAGFPLEEVYVDLDGNPRPSAKGLDVGPLEFSPVPDRRRTGAGGR